MKKSLLIVVLFMACKKGKNEDVTITVLETGTNTPVSAASVYLFRYNLDFIEVPVFSGVTDVNGAVAMDAQKYGSGSVVRIEKQQYWKFEGTKNTTLYVTPVGWLQLRLHPSQAYPPGTFLQLVVSTQDGSGSGSLTEVAADTDSTVSLFGFGNKPNKIFWRVYSDAPALDKNGTINNLEVPRFDTLHVTTLDY